MKWTANQNELTVWQTQRSRVIALLFLPVSYGAPFPSCNQRLVWKSNRMPSWGSTASDKADWMNVLLHDQRNTHCLPKCTPPSPQSSIFLHCGGNVYSTAVPWLWMISVQCSEGCPTPRSPNAAYFSRKLQWGVEFGKQKHKTWCVQCHRKATNKSIWPYKMDQRLYNIELCNSLMSMHWI